MSKKLLVVKVGTTVLANTVGRRQKLRLASFKSIASDIRSLQKLGYDIVLVSSAAITAGSLEDKIDRQSVTNTVEEQRLAARGWDIIVQKWKKALLTKTVSSALITKSDLSSSPRLRKLLNVIECCLAHGDVFLVNENDCLSDDEIKFGDNDILSAHLAVAIANNLDYNSVKLVLLTSASGLNQIANDDKTLIKEVRDVDDVRQCALDPSSQHSKGGMASKLMAVDIASKANINAYITSGRALKPISSAINRKKGTRFTPKQ